MNHVYITDESKKRLQYEFVKFLNSPRFVEEVSLSVIIQYEKVLKLLRSIDILILDLILHIVYEYINDEIIFNCAFNIYTRPDHTVYYIFPSTNSFINFKSYYCMYDLNIKYYASLSSYTTEILQLSRYITLGDSMTTINPNHHYICMLEYNMTRMFNKYMKNKYNINTYIKLLHDFTPNDFGIVRITNNEQFETTVMILKQIIDIIIPLFVKKIEST